MKRIFSWLINIWMRGPISLVSGYVLFGLLWLYFTNLIVNHMFGNTWPDTVVALRFLAFLMVTGFLSFLFLVKFNPVVRSLRIATDKALKDSEEIFESVFHYTTDAIVVFDLEMTVLKFNPTFEKMYGYTCEELGGSILPIIPKDDIASTRGYFEVVKSGAAPYQEFTGTRICKDGSTLEVMIRFSPLKDASGQIVGVSSIVKDITEIVKTQDLLVNSEKLLAVGELAAGVAHEIRNPLTSIAGFAHILPSAPLEKQPLYAQFIKGEIDRIDRIVNELLTLSKPRLMEYVSARLDSVLVEVSYLLEAQAHLNTVQLVPEFEANAPEVMCDVHQLKQVFINVMKNAIEAMPKGGCLTIGLRSIDEAVEVSFRDTGQGIAEDQLKRIGSPFFTTKETGTGLGLLACKRILDNHRGFMEIASKPGEGTTVTITIPLSRSNAVERGRTGLKTNIEQISN